MTKPARRSDQVLAALTVAAGLLMAWGAFALLGFMEEKDLIAFWLRLALGVVVAAVTVWAAVGRRWLLTAFLALGCCVTPVAEGWTWVQLLYIGIAVWALVKFFAEIMGGRVSD